MSVVAKSFTVSDLQILAPYVARTIIGTETSSRQGASGVKKLGKVSGISLAYKDSLEILEIADVAFMIRPANECKHEYGITNVKDRGVYTCKKCGGILHLKILKNRYRKTDEQMCTANEERIIKMTVEEILQQGKMFTSVDVGNKIKLSGTWISNHEVATYLRANAISIANALNIPYDHTPIKVQIPSGATRDASLYHPVGANTDDYKERNQRALDPIQANRPKAATTSVNIQATPPVAATTPAPAPSAASGAATSPTTPDPGFDISPWRVACV